MVKWTGSKRLQAPTIIKHFPSEIDTYYEPFLGGASMLYILLSSNIKVKKYFCSDLNPSLIGIWQMVRDDPQALIDYYRLQWDRMDKDLYLKIRSEHNRNHDPRKFLVLLRTCRNGLVRYNSKGEFNSAFHFGRKGLRPDKFEATVLDWHKKLAKVEFSVRNYLDVSAQKGDLIYLDPPYARSSNFQMYYSEVFDLENLWNWMRNQPCSQLLSLNGFKNDLDCRVGVPEDLYDKTVLIDNGLNKYDQMVNQRVVAKDSLYISNVDSK